MEWEATIGKNIMYGGETPLEALLSLVVDDGDANREHRNNIFSTDYF